MAKVWDDSGVLEKLLDERGLEYTIEGDTLLCNGTVTRFNLYAEYVVKFGDEEQRYIFPEEALWCIDPHHNAPLRESAGAPA